MKKILYGPVANNCRQLLLEKAGSLVEKGKSSQFCYLAPTYQMINSFREKLLTDYTNSGTGKLHFYLFQGFFNELLKDSGSYQPLISTIQQEIVLRKVVKKLVENGQLEYFQSMVDFDGFYNGLVQFIEELNTGANDLTTIKSSLGANPKEKEIAVIINEYKKHLIDNNLTDKGIQFEALTEIMDNELSSPEQLSPSINSAERMNNEPNFANIPDLADMMNNGADSPAKIDFSLLNNLELIIIDGFQRFTGRQYRFMQMLKNYNLDLFINIKYDRDRASLYKNIEEIFQQLDYQIDCLESKNDYSKPQVLKHIEKNLFTLDSSSIEADSSIQFIETADRQSEVKQIARECKNLLSKGIVPEDIAVVVRNPANYRLQIDRVFAKIGLPFSNVSGISPVETPVWRVVEDIFKVINNNLKREYVLNLLKSNYLNILKQEQYAAAEEMINDYQIIKGKHWYRLKDNDDQLAAVILSLLDDLYEIKGQFSRSHDFSYFGQIIWSFLKKYSLYQMITAQENIDLVSRDLKVLDYFKNALDELGHIIGAVDSREFLYWLHRYLGGMDIRDDSGQESKIQILTPSQVREANYEYVFICGLLEGQFPAVSGKHWLFNKQEREKLKQQGLYLTTVDNNLIQERYFFYRSITAANKRVYLTYPSLGAEAGGELVSSFAKDVKLLFDRESLNTIRITNKYDPGGTAVAKTADENKVDLGGIVTLEDARYFYLKHQSKEQIANLLPAYTAALQRWSGQYSSWDGIINDEEIQLQIKAKYNDDYVYSSSELEEYANCPFKFFAGRILKLSEPEEPLERLDALRLGNLYHLILYNFFSNYYPGNWQEELDNYTADLETAAGEVFQDFADAVSLPVGMWEIYQQEILSKLKAVIESEWEEKGYLPAFLEMSFGLGQELQEDGSINYPQPVKLELGQQSIYVRGKIDRVDLSADKEKAVIWDYKFGDKRGIFNRMVDGYDLQLPLYLMVGEKIFEEIVGKPVVIAGAGYYSIKSNKKYGIWREQYQQAAPVTGRSSSCLSEEDWQQHLGMFKQYISDIINGIKSGDYRINPEDCDYCDFQDICRYQRKRVGDYSD